MPLPLHNSEYVNERAYLTTKYQISNTIPKVLNINPLVSKYAILRNPLPNCIYKKFLGRERKG